MQLNTQQRKATIPAPSLDVQPSQTLRNRGSNISLGLSGQGEHSEKNESSRHQLDSSRERNATRPLAQQVDRTTSARTSAKPSTSSPPLNRPSASTSPLPPLPAPALTMTTSSQVHAARNLPTDRSQARPGGASLELPHHRGEEKRKTQHEQGRTSHSATQSGPPPPPDKHSAAATEPLSQFFSGSAPHRLNKSVSRSEAKQATDGSTSDKKEGKEASAPKEYETRVEHSNARSDGAKRREAESNLSTSYAPNVILDTNASVQQTYSSNGHGNVFSAPHLSETDKSRGKDGQSSDSTPSWSKKETVYTTPPASSVYTSSQPKHVTRVPSNSDAIVSKVEQKPRPPSVADSHIKFTPSSMSPSFHTDLRSIFDSLLLALSREPSIVAGPLINQGGHGSHESFQFQEPPGFLTETEQREDNAMAALEGHYRSDLIVENCSTAFSRSPPGPSAVKQKQALIKNEGKFQQGGINGGYSL